MRFKLGSLFIAFTLLSLVVGIALTQPRWSQIVVSLPEVANNHRIVLESSTDSAEVSRLSIEISGRLAGRATISLPWYGNAQLGPGAIQRSFSAEYYDNIAVINYAPTTVKSGELIVKYRFY